MHGIQRLRCWTTSNVTPSGRLWEYSRSLTSISAPPRFARILSPTNLCLPLKTYYSASQRTCPCCQYRRSSCTFISVPETVNGRHRKYQPVSVVDQMMPNVMITFGVWRKEKTKRSSTCRRERIELMTNAIVTTNKLPRISDHE
jgi:hypothetical protein